MPGYVEKDPGITERSQRNLPRITRCRTDDPVRLEIDITRERTMQEDPAFQTQTQPTNRS